ncbi:hypothetical protein KC340_g6 [Hortaea werneckii]|nr:hypothetical protein KC340_g6 [Hortaea werneckii]
MTSTINSYVVNIVLAYRFLQRLTFASFVMIPSPKSERDLLCCCTESSPKTDCLLLRAGIHTSTKSHWMTTFFYIIGSESPKSASPTRVLQKLSSSPLKKSLFGSQSSGGVGCFRSSFTFALFRSTKRIFDYRQPIRRGLPSAIVVERSFVDNLDERCQLCKGNEAVGELTPYSEGCGEVSIDGNGCEGSPCGFGVSRMETSWAIPVAGVH